MKIDKDEVCNTLVLGSGLVLTDRDAQPDQNQPRRKNPPGCLTTPGSKKETNSNVTGVTATHQRFERGFDKRLVSWQVELLGQITTR